MDTPGDSNFQADGRIALAALDGAVVVLSAVGGAKVGTQRMRSACEEAGLPLLAFVNGLDEQAVEQLLVGARRRRRGEVSLECEPASKLADRPMVAAWPQPSSTSSDARSIPISRRLSKDEPAELTGPSTR